jgi:hypothetical protein
MQKIKLFFKRNTKEKIFGLVCDRDRHMKKFVWNKCWVKGKETPWVVFWRIQFNLQSLNPQ